METSKSKKQVLTVEKFDMVCRTCLGFFQSPYQCYTLLDNVSLSRTVGDMLKLHADVDVEESDELPQNICSDCFEKLHSIVGFVRRCQQADSRLHVILEQNRQQGIMIEQVAGQSNTEDGAKQSTYKVSVPSGSGEEIIEIKVEEDDMDDTPAQDPEYIVNQIFGRQSSNDQYDSDDVIEGEAYIEAEAYIDGDGLDGVEQETFYICTICNEGFLDSKDLELHLRKHVSKQSDEKMKKSVMMEVIGGALNEEEVEPKEDLDSNTCKICNKVFATPLGLEIHGPSHNINTRKKRQKKSDSDGDDSSSRMCHQCNKVFASKLGLQSHKVRHQEKAFTCDKCGYKFHTKASLEIHYRSHSGEKPYKCSYCEKAFSQHGSLTLHTLTHTGERPHKCHLCPSAFKQGHHLQYHLQSHSGEKPYVCSVCEKGFASKRNLIIHSRSHTGEKEFFCPICGKGFYDRHGVNKHIKRHVYGNSKVRHSENEQILIGDEYTTLDKLLFKGQR